MPSAAVRKFMSKLPPEDSELDVCPPGCRKDHDAKWYGVTVPARKKPKVEKGAATKRPKYPFTFPPADTIYWEEPYYSLTGDDWRKAVLRDEKSCWIHKPWVPVGKIVEPAIPTAKQLEAYAKKYGPSSPATLASVQEVADMYGIKISIPRTTLKPKKRPRGPSRLERAKQLRDLDIPWSVIEDELNLTRPQSVELQEELGER